MPTQPSVQASIVDRLDRAIAQIVEEGHRPSCIFLTKDDRDQLDQYETLKYRAETGSTAFVWPSSYRDIQLYSEKLIERLEIPVRQRMQRGRLKSTVYASTGQGFRL